MYPFLRACVFSWFCVPAVLVFAPAGRIATLRALHGAETDELIAASLAFVLVYAFLTVMFHSPGVAVGT